jgi:hypothetical protein
MSIATANMWRLHYAKEQLRHQQHALAKGEPVTLSLTRRARLKADEAFKDYLQDLAAIHLEFFPCCSIPASDLYISLVWPAPYPIHYRRFIRLFLELFPTVRAFDRGGRTVFTGVGRREPRG